MAKTQRPKAEETSELPEPENVSTIQIRRPESLPRYYSNHVVSRVSPWDIELLFGELVRDEGMVAANVIVSVMLSPQHAKAVAKLITSQVKQYEERYGELVDIANLQVDEG